MTTATLTLEQELWMMDQIKPAPEVLVFCYVPMLKDWVLIWQGTRLEASEVKDWFEKVKRRYSSATLVRIYNLPSEPTPCLTAS